MPKERDPEKWTDDGKYLKSRLDKTKKYNKESYDTFLLRIPKGTKEALTQWVTQRAEEEPDNPRYNDLKRNRASVNAFVISLIEEATGIPLKK